MVLKSSNKIKSTVSVNKTVSSSTTSSSSSFSRTQKSEVSKKVPSAGGSSTSGASPIPAPVECDIHLHCENCINVATCQDSTCPIVLCDCGHKLHECKLEDHALLCRENDFKGHSRTVVRKVKKVETTVVQSQSTMTSGKQEQPKGSAASSNRESLTRQPSIHAVREASPVEEVKLSIDKKKLQSQFSVDSGDVDGKCKRCQTTVYPAERIRAEKAQYHKKCFTCKECKKSLSAESYHSHESELYCANHFKQLFQPKANFDNVAPPRRQREPIIRENEPAQLPPDVVRCGTGSTMEDLEGLTLNLASIKSQFEKNQTETEANKQPTLDRSASSRSDVLRKRLERYQSVVAGEAKAESSDDEENEDQADSKKIEHCREIGELKAQWESGRVNAANSSSMGDDDSIRDKVSPGLSKTMKVAYEKAIMESHTKETKVSVPEEVTVGQAYATTLKKKFESGEVVKEEEAVRLEAVKSEKEEDLSVCQEPVIAQQAKLMFQKIDKEITSRPAPVPAPGPVRTPSDSRWSRATFGEAPKDVEVVHSHEPTYKEQVEVETAALSERYRFFENYREEAASVSKKKFQMTPPREIDIRDRDVSPSPVCERDPNVVVGSIITDDIPNVDTATKMRQKFETLCQTSVPQEPIPKTCQAPKPRPLKRTTSSTESTLSQVTTSATHVIEEDCMPADNITKNMRAVFERNNSTTSQNNGTGPAPPLASTERSNPPKVNRFV